MLSMRAMAIVLSLASVTAKAAVIAYEGFAYVPSPLSGHGPSNGFSGPWAADAAVLVQAASLSSPLAAPSTGGAINGSFNYTANLTNSLVNHDFWASYLVSHSGVAANQVYVGLTRVGTSLSSPPDVAFGIRASKYTIIDNVSTGTASAATAVTAAGSTDYLLAHFVPTGPSYNVSLFVNPVAPLGVPNVSTLVPQLSYGQVLGQNQGEFVTDEIRIGDSPAEAGLVPEPGALSLLCIGGMGLLARRRGR